ncbi:MAG: hypothetical protein JXA42_03380 [Anaerolineales bacterium]|nr:hypothetical protein [Anaerolineales bacterium]
MPTVTVTSSLTNTPQSPASTKEPTETAMPTGNTSLLDPSTHAYPPPHQTSPLPSPLGTPYSGSLDPYWDAAGVELAIVDLAERLEKAPDSIEVLTIAPDEFPGGDMGCPNPKEPASNSPSIVTGYRVILKNEGESYEYHTRRDHIAFCGKLR